LIISNYTLTN